MQTDLLFLSSGSWVGQQLDFFDLLFPVVTSTEGAS